MSSGSSPRKVLVTGGTGYLASRCIIDLLARGDEVVATVRASDRETALRTMLQSSVTTADAARLSCAVADLGADDGWSEAANGCTHVLHVASPMGLEVERDADHAIATARDGALRVLGAATAAGVRRVVMTSAANASSPSSYTEDGVTDETLWTDPDEAGMQPYRRAKTVAERAAWDLVATAAPAANGVRTSLTTVLPGAVFGPVLPGQDEGSVGVIGRMLRGAMPAVPRIGLEVVDVRDVADIHIRAMDTEAAGGQRFLATGEFLWMSDIAAILRDALDVEADRVPTRTMPDLLFRSLAKVKPELRGILPGLGRRHRHTTAKAEALLGWRPRPAREAVIACARSLLERDAEI